MFSLNFLSKRVPDLKILVVREMHKTQSKSHYDALGLTPKATLTDIKKAYYKMSMIYHPDKEDTGCPEKFREITTAYEVLGNLKLRKLYDQGQLPSGAASYAREEQSAKENPETRHKRQQANQNFYQNVHTTFDKSEKKKKVYTGKTEHFDYDAWLEHFIRFDKFNGFYFRLQCKLYIYSSNVLRRTRAHYEDMIQREQISRAQFAGRKIKKEEIEFRKTEKNTLVGIFCAALFLFWFMQYTSRYDQPSSATTWDKKRK